MIKGFRAPGPRDGVVYICHKCGNRFTAIMGLGIGAKCPSCGSRSTSRDFTVLY